MSSFKLINEGNFDIQLKDLCIFYGLNKMSQEFFIKIINNECFFKVINNSRIIRYQYNNGLECRQSFIFSFSYLFKSLQIKQTINLSSSMDKEEKERT